MNYLLSCTISASVRQSIQIKFDDLKLPPSVIDTLEKNNTVSLRPNLSNALKTELDALRVMQRELYDNYCIHFGDTHFVTENYFYHADRLIKKIRAEGKEANKRLFGLWESEYAKWRNTVEGFLLPLFKEEREYKLVSDAYLRVFPTVEEYKNPIGIYVVGPLPISLEVVTHPTQSDVQSLIIYENSINTKEVIEAAHANAADKALYLGAELLDDLDVRTVTKVGRQQTGGDRKRGSWQVTAEKLKLISDSVVGFDILADLANQLLSSGNAIQSPIRQVREEGCKRFQELQQEIRTELEAIVNSRDTSKGLETLQKSLALSNTYITLCEKIKTAENITTLNELVKEANIELDIYAQRSKHLNKMINQRCELVGAMSNNIENSFNKIEENSQLHCTPDF
jgi:hypothetical protein